MQIFPDNVRGTRVQSRGDGSCLFYSLAQTNEIDAKKLRKEISTYMKTILDQKLSCGMTLRETILFEEFEEIRANTLETAKSYDRKYEQLMKDPEWCEPLLEMYFEKLETHMFGGENEKIAYSQLHKCCVVTYENEEDLPDDLVTGRLFSIHGNLNHRKIFLLHSILHYDRFENIYDLEGNRVDIQEKENHSSTSTSTSTRASTRTRESTRTRTRTRTRAKNEFKENIKEHEMAALYQQDHNSFYIATAIAQHLSYDESSIIETRKDLVEFIMKNLDVLVHGRSLADYIQDKTGESVDDYCKQLQNNQNANIDVEPFLYGKLFDLNVRVYIRHNNEIEWYSGTFLKSRGFSLLYDPITNHFDPLIV